MTLASHSLIAVAIASKVTNPALGLPLIFISHFLVDKIPHWDVMTNKNKSRNSIIAWSLLDLILGYVAAYAVSSLAGWTINPIYFLTAIFISQLPDLAEGPHVLFAWAIPSSKLFYNVQHYIHDLWFDSKLGLPWGIVTQVATVGVFLLWALT